LYKEQFVQGHNIFIFNFSSLSPVSRVMLKSLVSIPLRKRLMKVLTKQ